MNLAIRQRFAFIILLVTSLLIAVCGTSAAADDDSGYRGSLDKDKVEVDGLSNGPRAPKPGPVTVKGKNPKAPSAGSSSKGNRGPKFIWDTTTVCDFATSDTQVRELLKDACSLTGKVACSLEGKNTVFAIGLGGDGSKPVDCVGLRKNTGPGTQGAGTPAPPPPPTISTEDFQSLTIPASTLKSQLGGFTLKGAHTNLYADGGTQHLDTIVLGQPVTVRATPISYSFTYGDGTKLTTKTPGGPVAGNGFDIQTETSHIYTKTGIFTATLTTSYTGEFSVNNGPYQPIPGTANTTSTPLNIDVWRTKHYRVAEPCNNNNTAPGCTPNR